MTTLSSISVFGQDTKEVTTLKSSYKILDNGDIELNFQIKIADGWYLYGATPIENGPLNCTFEMEPSDKYKAVGSLQNGQTPHKKIDPSFEIEVEYFEPVAYFKQIIKPITKDKFLVKGMLNYQTCNGGECLINDKDVVLNVTPQTTPVSDTTTTVIAEQQVETIQTPVEKITENESEAKPETKEDSLLIFLLIAFAAGLGGVITPCVFPMIPMTVGFLAGGGSRKEGITKGLIFGLSVILIYTALGLIVALFQSTSATDALGTHWIPNLIFALLFLVFAISFLGAFEITLPSGLANKADKQADKGGYIAAFFVAFAMVIVSFSCTGPFVGSILAAAVVGGVALKPILGMAAFGLAFSLPFVVFSFFPGIMKSMPKSGSWLNVVKVVFAFVMLAFAMKFFYNVDAYFGWGIITRLGFLSIWISLTFLLGLYFLGLIRTSHDSEVKGLGWGRMIAAIVCFSFTLYMIPGLFGAPLKSISGLIPPLDGTTLVISGESKPSESTKTSSISGYSSLISYPSIEAALEVAKKENKPILLSFKSHTCSVCKVMESTVLNENSVLDKLKSNFIIANLYVDDKTPDSEYKTLGKRLRKYQTEKFYSASQPLYVIIDTNENILSGPIGSSSLEEYIKFLNY